MLREKVERVAKTVFAGLTMALCVAAFSPAAPVEAATLQESEPNETPAEANQLPLNTWMRGVSQVYGDEDWYQFVIPQSGVSQVQLALGEDNPDDDSEWYVTLLDEDRHQFNNFYVKSGKTYALGLAPGKYYVKVKQKNRYGEKDSYNLRVNYTASDSWEREIYYGNKNPENANIAYVNKVYTGNLYSYADVDWYRFKLTGNNKLSLRFAMDDTVSNPGEWKIELSEYNSRKVLGTYRLDTNETLTINKCSGDLLVKVSNGSYAAGDIYHLQLQRSEIKPAAKPVVKPGTTKITSIKAGKRRAAIYWKKASNATGYYVYRATSPRGKYTRIATVTGKTSYLDKKSLKSKKNYYYKIVSIRKSGSKVLTSKASAYKGVKIK